MKRRNYMKMVILIAIICVEKIVSLRQQIALSLNSDIGRKVRAE